MVVISLSRSRSCRCSSLEPTGGAHQGARYLFRFSVAADEQIEVGGAFHSAAQRRQIDVREIADPAVAHNRFQTHCAAIAERFQVRQISRDEPAPETKIDMRDS